MNNRLHKIQFLLGTYQEIHFIPGSKHPKLIFDNYQYNLEKKTMKKTIWSCTMKGLQKCKARLTTYGKTLCVFNEIHNHPPVERNYNPVTSLFVNVVKKQINI